MIRALAAVTLMVLSCAAGTLEDARDAQDKPALERLAQEALAKASSKASDASLWHHAALSYSYLAEVALEVRDKGAARSAAEAGIKAAEKAVSLNGSSSEYHRILGTLCGQVIPANVLAGLRWGRCALDEVNRAIQLDGKSAMAYLSRGVGNYYLPESFGGGAEVAIKDLRKALELNPKLPEGHLWLGIALRKAGKNAEARASLLRALALNPKRVWAKQQLEKTPAQ
ncbi:MAG TPA: tetratricopeptide repeat protein [Bryobacteraceae bacterium]|nr:tetratricopeptide repeat protein [Bryobacteraceae bacterium]